MPETNAHGALYTMERLRYALEMAAWPHQQITASFGIATLHPRNVAPQELVNAADDALYRSKQAGRNRITHADALTGSAVIGQSANARAGFAA